MANHTLICCGTNPGSIRKEQTRYPGIFKQPALLVFVCTAVIYSLNTHCFFFTASLYISLCIPMKGEVGHDSEKKDVQFLPQILQEADLRHPVKLSWKDSRGRDTCQTLILIKRTPDALDFLHFGIPFEPSSARPLVYFWRYCLLLIKPRFIGLPINPLMALLHLLYVPFVSCWVSWSLFNVFGLRGMCL